MHHAIAIGKSILATSRILNRSGSTWPGHIVLKADPKFIRKALAKNPGIHVIFIAGTNGKTTTTKALTHILETSGFSVLTNASGANLLNGLASILVKHISMNGTLKHKALIFEVDENSLPLVLAEIPHPNGLILLNLFRDQLDRYGEVNSTSEKWRKAIKKLDDKTTVIANADDPLIHDIAATATHKFFYTIDNRLKTQASLSHAVDSTTCPRCQHQLIYSKIAYSHVGNYQCPNCAFANPKAKQYEIKTSLLGKYNLYNLSASILAADKIFKITPYASTQGLTTFTPAFGRQETIGIDGRDMMLLLSKNPTGFNESLDVVLQSKSESLLLLLNDRAPDGKDISWIWDVDFEKLANASLKIFVSGDRSYDLANRLLFAGVSHEVFESYEKAYQQALSNTSINKLLTILPTYSAMLDIRKLISGKAIL